MIVDKPLLELEQYKPALTRQPDFDVFWERSLIESAKQPLHSVSEKIAYPVEQVSVYHVQYDGFGPNTRISGWYIVPKHRQHFGSEGRTPTIMQYHGYSGGKGLPGSYLHWAAQGYCVFTVDTRGQGGDTPDNAHYQSGGAVGFMTKGIDDPTTYYYRYAYMDCVRALEVARSFTEVGPIFVTGGSQGGGLTLAVAALVQDKGIAGAMVDYPFLCHVERSLELFTDGPYHELVHLWKRLPFAVQKHLRTLSYFDGMNIAPRISYPVLLSVGLLDTVCPPSTAFAVYNHLLSVEKQIAVYPYNGHEGGGAVHDEEKYRFVRRCLSQVENAAN